MSMNKKPRTYDERKRIADLYNAGVTPLALFERFGIQHAALRKITIEFNCTKQVPCFSHSKRQLVK